MAERRESGGGILGFIRFTLRTKIILLVTLVALGVVLVTGTESYYAHQPVSRGRFLRKHYNRFDEYRRGVGRALAASAAFVALDPELRRQLSARDHTGAERVVHRVETDLGNAAAAVGDATARTEEADPETAAYERVVSAVRNTLDPDLVLLFDRTNRTIGSSVVSDAEASQLRLFADVLAGLTVSSELAVLADHVFQVSASPVRDDDGNVVGGIVLGQRVERYMRAYQVQSDADETKQHRLTLVDGRSNVLATVFPEESKGALGEALMPDHQVQEQEGPDETVPCVVFEGNTYDIWDEAVTGYRGQDYGELGRFFLLRTRDFKNDEVEQWTGSLLFLLGGIFAAAVAIGWAFAWFITRRINRYVSATEDLARGEGDLTRRLDAGGRDELGRLARNLNAVFGYIHDLAASVQSSAFQVGASSAEISAASKQMLEGAQEQARKTEGSSAAVTELSASIQQVAENAMEATRVARSSGEAVQGAIERMNEIRTTVEEAAAKIQELGESGKRIGNIVEVIRQISDQTTLLALNAAIEAAHAGEQGRGFAVVADEVSQLAKRVGQSARDIEDLIATIKEQTAEAVRAMEAGTEEVEAGTSLVTSTLGDLQMLVGVVEDTAKAVQEQAVASDEIARNMDVVQRIAQDVLGASEEAVAQGEHLHRLAHGLEQSVKGFKITSTAAGDATRPALPSGDGNAE